jgi:CheY-like chemotaxis protein
VFALENGKDVSSSFERLDQQRLPCVLIADDEPSLSTVLCRALSRYTYAPIVVSGGAAAIAAVRANPYQFQCVLMDIVMPDIDGIQAAHTIHQMNPDLPIVLMSGSGGWHGLMDCVPIAALLHKPFRINELVQVMALHMPNIKLPMLGGAQ